jgi:hypothetical protein
VATITSTPWVFRPSVAARGAARETTTVSATSDASATSREPSGRRASESNTTRRGWRTLSTSGRRAVSCGSSAIAVPIPTTTASTAERHSCTRLRLGSPEIHCESPA